MRESATDTGNMHYSATTFFGDSANGGSLVLEAHPVAQEVENAASLVAMAAPFLSSSSGDLSLFLV